MFRRFLRSNRLMSSASLCDFAYVSVSKRRVRTSASRSPREGESDQVSVEKSPRSTTNDLTASVLKTSSARLVALLDRPARRARRRRAAVDRSRPAG
jgi:hypothetical protein